MSSLIIFLHGSSASGSEQKKIFLDALYTAKVNGYQATTKSFVDALLSNDLDLITPSAPERFYVPANKKKNVWYNHQLNIDFEQDEQAASNMSHIEESIQMV